jgi:hypothetical protein
MGTSDPTNEQRLFACNSLNSKEVTLYTRIRELLGSNLDRDSGYADRNISWLSSFPPVKYVNTFTPPSKFFPKH